MMSRMTVLSLLITLLAVIEAEAENRRGCTAISDETEKMAWDELERSVSYRLRAHRLYLTTVRNAEAARTGDLSLCNKCAYEVISLKETIRRAPPSYLNPKQLGWHEEYRRISELTRELQREFVWPACDGKPVDWARFDEVR